MTSKTLSLSWNVEHELGKPLGIQIAEAIAEKIFNGRLQPGERLKEEELAEGFKTSRAPVREALYLLQIDGLVERLPRRGTVVREYTDKDIIDLYEVRATLECSAIDRLKTRWSEHAATSFTENLALMKSALDQQDSERYSRQNTEFHNLFLAYSGSDILRRLYQQLGNPLRFLVHFSTRSTTQMQSSYVEHENIVRHLLAGEFDVAKEVLNENVRQGMTRVIALRNE